MFKPKPICYVIVTKTKRKADSLVSPTDSTPPVVPTSTDAAAIQTQKKRNSTNKKRERILPPTKPLQLPAIVYVKKPTHEDRGQPVPEDCKVKGEFLYVDDTTGNQRSLMHYNQKGSSAYIFRFPNITSPEKYEYFVRPTAVESYIRGTETGKGWNAIYVDVDGGRRTLADYCNKTKFGFINDPKVTPEMRDNWCLLARARYERPSRVTVLRELEERSAAASLREQKRKDKIKGIIPKPTPLLIPAVVSTNNPQPECTVPNSGMNQECIDEIQDRFFHVVKEYIENPSKLVISPDSFDDADSLARLETSKFIGRLLNRTDDDLLPDLLSPHTPDSTELEESLF